MESEARPFQFSGRIRSFRHAISGAVRMLRCQHNAWIHAAATVLVLAGAFAFRVSTGDWCWIVLAISMVWTAEALNTAFEFLADAASPEFHPWFATRKISRPVRCWLRRSRRRSSARSFFGRTWQN